jgi:hypothetical protein
LSTATKQRLAAARNRTPLSLLPAILRVYPVKFTRLARTLKFLFDLGPRFAH